LARVGRSKPYLLSCERSEAIFPGVRTREIASPRSQLGGVADARATDIAISTKDQVIARRLLDAADGTRHHDARTLGLPYQPRDPRTLRTSYSLTDTVSSYETIVPTAGTD
jgi:hypothetical protein